MISEKERKLKDMYRKKYYDKENLLQYISIRKVITSLGISWGAWYKFIFYGANSISLKRLEKIDKGVKKELYKMKKEIDEFLEE